MMTLSDFQYRQDHLPDLRVSAYAPDWKAACRAIGADDYGLGHAFLRRAATDRMRIEARRKR